MRWGSSGKNKISESNYMDRVRLNPSRRFGPTETTATGWNPVLRADGTVPKGYPEASTGKEAKRPENVPDPSRPNLSTFPLAAEATFRMQTPFTHLGNLQSVSKLTNPQAGGTEQYNPPDATPPADLQPLPPPEAQVPDYEGDLPPPPDFSACRN